MDSEGADSVLNFSSLPTQRDVLFTGSYSNQQKYTFVEDYTFIIIATARELEPILSGAYYGYAYLNDVNINQELIYHGQDSSSYYMYFYFKNVKAGDVIYWSNTRSWSLYGFK